MMGLSRSSKLALDNGSNARMEAVALPAHAADVLRGAHFLAVQFGQAIHKVRKPLRSLMLSAVPTLVERWIAQAEIRRKVNELGSQRSVTLDLFLRFAVRQGQVQHIARLERLAGDETHRRTLAQVGMERVDVFAQDDAPT